MTTVFRCMIYWAADSDPNSMTTGFPADGADPADGRLDFDDNCISRMDDRLGLGRRPAARADKIE